MSFDESILKSDERAIYGLRSLYRKHGYTQYKMSKFEEYDLYLENKSFLKSDWLGLFLFSSLLLENEPAPTIYSLSTPTWILCHGYSCPLRI